jgi:Fe2+ or Zn2+ uptake regulation protein
LSQATVYNTLQTLAQSGLVQGIGTFGGGAVHYDGNPAPHVNFICKGCQRILDIPDVRLEESTEQAVAQFGYQVHDVRIVYSGLCPRCL